ANIKYCIHEALLPCSKVQGCGFCLSGTIHNNASRISSHECSGFRVCCKVPHKSSEGLRTVLEVLLLSVCTRCELNCLVTLSPPIKILNQDIYEAIRTFIIENGHPGCLM